MKENKHVLMWEGCNLVRIETRSLINSEQPQNIRWDGCLLFFFFFFLLICRGFHSLLLSIHPAAAWCVLLLDVSLLPQQQRWRQRLAASPSADFNEGQTLQTQISKRSISLANLSLLQDNKPTTRWTCFVLRCFVFFSSRKPSNFN